MHDDSSSSFASAVIVTTIVHTEIMIYKFKFQILQILSFYIGNHIFYEPKLFSIGFLL